MRKEGKRLATGNTADIYQNGATVIKYFHPRMPRDEAFREAEKQRIAYQLGLPVPKVKDVSDYKLEMEYIEGETLFAHMHRAPSTREVIIQQSIDIHKKIHSYEVDLPPQADRIRAQIEAAPGVPSSQKEELLQTLPTGRTLCHGDLHIKNMISGNGTTLVIDWADATAGDPYADLCRTYLLYALHDQELAAMFLELATFTYSCNETAITQWLPLLAAARLHDNIPGENQDWLLKQVIK